MTILMTKLLSTSLSLHSTNAIKYPTHLMSRCGKAGSGIHHQFSKPLHPQIKSFSNISHRISRNETPSSPFSVQGLLSNAVQRFKSLNLIHKKISHALPRLSSRSTKRLPVFCAVAFPSLCVGTDYLKLSPLGSLLLTAQCKSKGKSRLVQKDENGERNDPKFKWDMFWSLLWRDIFYLLGAIIAAIGAAMVNIQIPLMLGAMTNIVSNYTSEVTENVANFLEDIKGPASKLVAVYGLQSLLTFTYISLLSVVGENLAARLRKRLFLSLLHQDVDFFDRHKTGEIVDRLTSDVQEFKSSFKMSISQGLKATTQTVGCVVSLFLISPKLTMVMMGIIPLVILGGTFLGSSLRLLSRDAQDQISQSTAVADEALGNVRTVRAFAMEDKEFELYQAQIDKSCELNIRLGMGIGAFQGAANLFLNGIVLGSLFAGGWLISINELKAGDLISFLVATQMIERSMAQMSLLFGNVIRGMSAGARVFEFIDLEPKIPTTGGRTIPYHALQGDIKFTDVGFSYPSRPGQEILKDFNLHIKGGQMVALVGLSGGGKSTLAVLLERFYDVTSGAITLDGIDVRKLDPSWLRGRAIGFINQEPVLFATSVMENIRYGRPEATDQEVIEAAELANADKFIRSFPEGYNTVLGERGVTVSGGQKQRIAIARALIKNPSIMILDEATSALDTESERLVQEALDRVIKGRTTVVIAHRLSTIRDANMIAVVSKGKIMEMGTHDELKRKGGLYWELIKKQEMEEDLGKK